MQSKSNLFQSQWSVWFIFSTSGSILINKYVLSILGFKFPTIYQSWQMAFIFVALLTSWVFGYSKPPTISRSLAVALLPHSLLFAIGIYSGSVALSHLPVPIVCSVFGLSLSCSMLANAKLQNAPLQRIPKRQLILVCLQLTAILLCVWQHLDNNEKAFTWLGLHWVVTVLGQIYVESMTFQESDVSRMFYNASTSVVLLMAISVLSGEYQQSLLFPYFYLGRFHTGCLLSGAFGSLAVIASSKLVESRPKQEFSLLASVTMAAVSFLSYFFYESEMETRASLMCGAALISGIVYGYLVQANTRKTDTAMHIPVDEEKDPRERLDTADMTIEQLG